MCHYIYLMSSFLIFLCLFSSCKNNFLLGVEKHCSQYIYSTEKQAWTDASGQTVSCSIADGNRVFYYLPETGCSHWEQMFSHETVKFSVVPVKLGSGKYATAQKYCVKEQYIDIDNSGQVLLIDEGIFCLKKHPGTQDEYVFISCAGIQKKSLQKESLNK